MILSNSSKASVFLKITPGKISQIMSIRPMSEYYKNAFFFTKMLLRIVINLIEYHSNSTVKLE